MKINLIHSAEILFCFFYSLLSYLSCGKRYANAVHVNQIYTFSQNENKIDWCLAPN